MIRHQERRLHPFLAAKVNINRALEGLRDLNVQNGPKLAEVLFQEIRFDQAGHVHDRDRMLAIHLFEALVGSLLAFDHHARNLARQSTEIFWSQRLVHRLCVCKMNVGL